MELHEGPLLIELAQSAPDVGAFDRAVLELLGGVVGMDVAFLGGKAPGGVTGLGLDEGFMARVASPQGGYERELLPVKQAALSARGVAVDTAVLGEAGVRRCCYHRELAAPLGGRHSLLGYARLRGEVVAAVMLGRTGSSFGEREVAAVERLLPALAVARASFLRAPVPPSRPPPSPALSAREREVLDYLCLGYTNREIALALGSSPNTVRNQLARVFEKLGASTRAEAVAAALAR